jgi:hypothetical protein
MHGRPADYLVRSPRSSGESHDCGQAGASFYVSRTRHPAVRQPGDSHSDWQGKSACCCEQYALMSGCFLSQTIPTQPGTPRANDSGHLSCDQRKNSSAKNRVCAGARLISDSIGRVKKKGCLQVSSNCATLSRKDSWKQRLDGRHYRDPGQGAATRGTDAHTLTGVFALHQWTHV